MPQLTKRGKWVFGWVVVDKQGNFTIPPEAYREYGFRAGEEVLFLRGSRRSGEFSLGRVEKVPPVLDARVLARGRITEKSRVSVPVETGVQPGARPLAVRGSGLALLLLTQGPIYEKALNHPDLEVF